MSNRIHEDCSFGLHDYCTPCECECHVPAFTIEELRTLYKLIEHQYISYEDSDAHAVINKIMKIIKENDNVSRS